MASGNPACKYVVGIDLGTTNCVLAYADVGAEKPRIELLEVIQLTAPATCEERAALPSFLYLAEEHEAAQGAFDLPWAQGHRFVVGELARGRSAEAPQRTVASAKSWLCHSGVDRRQALLPWNAPADVPKISPVIASQRYLEHLAAAWKNRFPEAPLAEQQVVLTLPASFDAAARELTREAALAAGLPVGTVLLEEPQAAVYAWLAARGDGWRQELQAGNQLLVCDVGGGTTDLTLIEAIDDAGRLELSRLAVGDHLLVGGDNMDLALAHRVASLFKEKGTSLNAWQSVALWHACRRAKETLLAADAPDSHPVTVLGRGSKVIGGTVRVDVPRELVVDLIVEGFFPRCDLGDKPQRRRTSGFQEIGLPFASDAAITRHLAAFLTVNAQLGGNSSGARTSGATTSGATTSGAPPAGAARELAHFCPSHVLFNGGVFKSDALRQRVLAQLQAWAGHAAEPGEVRELSGERDLDFAVARGAAYYGWSKRRGGVRIRGGTARSYYVGIETSGLAIPGAPRPLRALCVVPLGMEEGSETDVPATDIGLVLGEAAHFRFFSSAVRRNDRPGDWIDDVSSENDDDQAPGDLQETDSLETTLVSSADGDENYVPVRFHSRITELGVLELWCVSANSDERWKLEFSVRET